MSEARPSHRELQKLVVEALPEAVTVYLFGSRATECARADSDVDLGVLAAAPLPPDRLAAAREILAERLRCDVDLVDLLAVSTVMRAQIVSTGVLLHDGEPALRESFEATSLSRYAYLNEERREILQRIRKEGTIHGR